MTGLAHDVSYRTGGGTAFRPEVNGTSPRNAQKSTRFDRDGQTKVVRDRSPLALPVSGLARTIEVKIASEHTEWEEAYDLVGASYRSRGYEAADTRGVRFTPCHALPDTTTFVAKHEGRVLTTFSLVPDNTLLGLPLEKLYEDEVQELRKHGRRLAEVTTLADSGLNLREFLQVFKSLIRLLMQYHVRHGGDTWVFTVNPRHRNFYAKVMGCVQLGPCRSYDTVQGAPAEAFLLDLNLLRANAPQMYDELFGKPLPAASLVPTPMPAHLVRYFGNNSSQTTPREVDHVLRYVEHFGSPRRW